VSNIAKESIKLKEGKHQVMELEVTFEEEG
jgi:hypothetical protein